MTAPRRRPAVWRKRSIRRCANWLGAEDERRRRRMGFSSYKLLGVDVARVDTTQENELGSRVTDQEGREYVYVKADGTGLTAGQGAKIAASYVVSASGSGHVYGVAHVALGANLYGWVQTK